MCAARLLSMEVDVSKLPKFIACSLLSFLFVYLSYWFCQMEGDPSKWLSIDRFFMLAFSLIVTFGSYAKFGGFDE